MLCPAVEAIPRLEPLPDSSEGLSSPRSGRSGTPSSPRSPIRDAVQQHVVDCTETAIGLTGMLLYFCLANTPFLLSCTCTGPCRCCGCKPAQWLDLSTSSCCAQTAPAGLSFDCTGHVVDAGACQRCFAFQSADPS